MKTKTNFKKTALRSGAVVVSFVLISFTVSAQDFWKKLLSNSSFNEIAMAMSEVPSARKTSAGEAVAAAYWGAFDQAFDPALELEGWMSDGDYFTLAGLQSELETREQAADLIKMAEINLQPDNSAPLKLEHWMLEETMWVN